MDMHVDLHVETCVGSMSLPQSTFGHFAPLIFRWFGGRTRFGKEISARVAMCGLGPQRHRIARKDPKRWLVGCNQAYLPRGVTKKPQCLKTVSYCNTKKSGTSPKRQRSIATVRKLQSQNQRYYGKCPKFP